MSTGPGAKAPLHRLTKEDRGPVVLIVAYSWIFISALVAAVRFGLARVRRLRFKSDDGTFLLGIAIAFASSIAFHLAVNGGLGKHMSKVDEAGLDQYFKMMYVAELLGICAQASAKVSVVLLSDRVAPRESRSYYFMLGLVAMWTVFAFFATAFQCPLPHPWVFNPSTCPSHGNLYYPIITFNIVTDALLAAWILPTLWSLLLETNKRITVVVLFGSRILVCGCAAAQLQSVATHIRSEDVTYSSFGRVLWGLCVIHLSVLLATLPRTNQFISAIQASHKDTRLTDFELANSKSLTKSIPLVLKKLTQSSSGAMSTPPTEAHAFEREQQQQQERNRERSSSPSRRSARSGEPIVDLPLQLTPSVEQGVNTQITSRVREEQREERRLANKKKYRDKDWRKYVRRSKNEGDDMNISTMFSWGSRASFGERIEVSREVTQEVEVVEPRESRWHIAKPRRLSRTGTAATGAVRKEETPKQ